MIKYAVWFVLMVLVGCSSVDTGVYRPKSSTEKRAFLHAEKEVDLGDVLADFQAFEDKELVWVGIIKDVQFRDTGPSVLVAFQVEHRYFDWENHGAPDPFHLSAEGEGEFMAGWEVRKPTSIPFLRTLSKPGDMLIVYGTPYRHRGEIVQLKATAVRAISDEDYIVVELESVD